MVVLGNGNWLSCGYFGAMYILHYAPDNASLIVRLTLEELGVPYETRLVDRSVRAQESADFRAINPAGAIPALETPAGVIAETGAILLWLSETHEAMAPAPGSAARAEFLKTMVFCANTVQAMLRMLFYPEKYTGPDPAAQATLRGTITTRHPSHVTLPHAFDLLEARYAGREMTGTPEVLDYYVGAMLRWSAIYPDQRLGWFTLRDYPALFALAEWLETRDATRAAQAAEGLGPTPFSAPRRPNPPEGSAL